MKCRMCSQQLTRVGRLCRECEHELERARRADVVVGELAEVVMRSDGESIARSTWSTKLRTPRNVVALAFCVGIVGGAVVVQHDSPRTTRSVMLDMAPPPGIDAHRAPRDAVAMHGDAGPTTTR